MKREITLLGLGRMGAAMAAHLTEQGYIVHGFARGDSSREAGRSAGVTVHDSATAAVEAQPAGERLIWLMVPADVVDEVLEELLPVLAPGDCIVDGGNSFYQDSLRRHASLKERNIDFLDCGTSGGMEGARHGASIMVGGEVPVFEKYAHVFQALATEKGCGFVGGPGAGHFVKMVHNGIEYGMMGALAEGLNVLRDQRDALNLRTEGILNAYEHGSIITSKLMSWLADAYREEGYLDSIAGTVPKGETEIEMEHLAAHFDVTILKAALEQRRTTREAPSYIGTLIAAMRNKFGGHSTVQK